MQKVDQLCERSSLLIEAALRQLHETSKEPLQTVSAAARSTTGEIYVATNLYHFTGGPDAEAIVLANVLLKNEDVDEIVAVHFDDNGKEKIINPCGRCRQMLNDYAPKACVIVDDDNMARSLRLGDILPFSYRNKASQYSRKKDEKNNES